MKQNISIPDDLWKSAQRTSTVGNSPSAIIQDALRRVTTADLSIRELDEASAKRLQSVREHLAAEATKTWNIGYRLGLNFAALTESRRILREIASGKFEDWQTDVAGEIYMRLEKDPDAVVSEVGVWDRRYEDPSLTLQESQAEQRAMLKRQPLPEDLWLRAITITPDCDVDTLAGFRELDPLIWQGTEAAFRDVLAVDDEARAATS